MPVSKSGKLYFTEKQYTDARCASALEYALSQGYDLVKQGKYYTLREHDSMVLAENGQWYWNSRDLHGGAIEFMTQYEHRPLVEAVLYLAGERGLSAGQAPITKKSLHPQQATETEKKPFELPENSGNYKRLFAYLCKSRHLDGDIIKDLTKANKLYPGGEYSNAVFVSYDSEGNPKGAFQRGTSSFSKTPFKMEVPSSDKSYAFHIPGNPESKSVAVFEAAIDAISHATLCKMQGQDYRDIHRISIGGCNDFRSVERFLEEHPKIVEIITCLDNDQAGQMGAQNLGEQFADRYAISMEIPGGKDWNEDLCSKFPTAQQPVKSAQNNQQQNVGELEL